MSHSDPPERASGRSQPRKNTTEPAAHTDDRRLGAERRNRTDALIDLDRLATFITAAHGLMASGDLHKQAVLVPLSAFQRVQALLHEARLALECAAAMAPLLDHDESLRAWGSRYVRLVLERCHGNKREACRVLGITYHTLNAYLRYPSASTMQADRLNQAPRSQPRSSTEATEEE